MVPRLPAAAARPPRRPGRLTVECLEDRLVLAGDVVLDWNDVLLDAIREDRTAPPVAARGMAIVHAAVYDAVNAIEQTHEPYAFPGRGPRGASAEAAVAAAAHLTLSQLFPGQQAAFDAALAASLAEVPDGPAERQGVAHGRAVAQHLLALRRHDGADQVVAYTPGTEPGDWQPTPPGYLDPLLPQWPSVTPFTMASGSQFRPPAPPGLTSAEYTAAFDEVKDVGAVNSTTRTPEQTQIARFWINGPGTATPPGHWNEAAQEVAVSRGNTLAGNARLFALLNLALADAGIVSWDAKYAYDYWRPVTAIRAADADGNPDTAADPGWTPLIVTPPFPAYTSGHSTFSAAAAAVLAGFFGTDQVAFTLRSETPDAADRSFASFSEAAWESGVSRIYGGIHWSFDNTQGLATGEELGHFVSANFLRPRSPRGGHADRLAADPTLASPAADDTPAPATGHGGKTADLPPAGRGGSNRHGEPAGDSGRTGLAHADPRGPASAADRHEDGLDLLFGSAEGWEPPGW